MPMDNLIFLAFPGLLMNTAGERWSLNSMTEAGSVTLIALELFFSSTSDQCFTACMSEVGTRRWVSKLSQQDSESFPLYAVAQRLLL